MSEEPTSKEALEKETKDQVGLPIHHHKIHSIPDEYKIAIDRQEKESDRFWARSNIMLLVQGALISFYIGLQGKDSLFGIITVLEGILLAVIWLGVLAKGKSYVSRWDAVIRSIEDSSIKTGDLQYPLADLYREAKVDETSSLVPLSRKSTTKLMQYAVLSILVFWIAALTLTLTVGIDESPISSASGIEVGAADDQIPTAEELTQSDTQVAAQPEEAVEEDVEAEAPSEIE
ncbi:MAG: hypothetical protein AAFQ79_05225 [Pseudomonadota bacterium]